MLGLASENTTEMKLAYFSNVRQRILRKIRWRILHAREKSASVFYTVEKYARVQITLVSSIIRFGSVQFEQWQIIRLVRYPRLLIPCLKCICMRIQ